MRFATPILAAMLGCHSLSAQQEPRQGPVSVSSGVMSRQILKRVEPVFPREAIDAKVNGAVVCRVVIDKDGKVRDATVISGPEMMRKNYLEAIRQWKYRPYLLNGQPVEVITQIAITIHTGAPSSSGAVLPSSLANAQSEDAPQFPPSRVRVSSGVMWGLIITHTDPKFCAIRAEALKRGEFIGGQVSVHAVVGRDGSIMEADAISGPELLRQTMIDAVKTWRYRPYLLNGEPVEVDTQITISENCGG